MSIEPLVTVEYLANVNELLPQASPIGAYCIGLVSMACWEAGVMPSRELLAAAAECPSPEAATELFEVWRRRLRCAKS